MESMLATNAPLELHYGHHRPSHLPLEENDEDFVL